MLGNTDGANESAQESMFCNLACFVNDLHTRQWPQCPEEAGEGQRVRYSPEFTDQESRTGAASGLGTSAEVLPALSAHSVLQHPSFLLMGQWDNFSEDHPERACFPPD